MKKTIFLLICVFIIVALVSCDSDGASSGSKSEKLTAEQLVAELLESGAINMMGILDSVGPDWEFVSTTEPTYHVGTEYVATLEENGTIVKNGKHYHRYMECPLESRILMDSDFIIDIEAMAQDQQNPETLSITYTESVEYEGLTEQVSTYAFTLNPENYVALIEYLGMVESNIDIIVLNHLDDPSPATCLAIVSAYLETERAALQQKFNDAFSVNATFHKIIIEGINYDPAPVGPYLSSVLGEYMAEKMIWVYKDSILDIFSGY